MHEDSASPSSPMTVLIAGCGQLGTEAGLGLVAEGHRVHGLRRSAGRLPPELSPISADLSDPPSLAHLPRAEVVLFILTPGSFDDGAYRRAYVDNLRRLLDTLGQRDALPRRLVYVSSTSVYGQADGSWVDENSATEPSGFSGRRLLEGEALTAGSGVEEVVAVRFGGIYGPTRTRLLRNVENGAAVCHDDPPIWTNRIHATDAARILGHLTTLNDP
ncbi:MAG: sugar nucleotide-binding protein, partial [Holophagales bacterium]|nr:sugar nucleotide-binding protein [Holophagales bacterium]